MCTDNEHVGVLTLRTKDAKGCLGIENKASSEISLK